MIVVLLLLLLLEADDTPVDDEADMTLPTEDGEPEQSTVKNPVLPAPTRLVHVVEPPKIGALPYRSLPGESAAGRRRNDGKESSVQDFDADMQMDDIKQLLLTIIITP